MGADYQVPAENHQRRGRRMDCPCAALHAGAEIKYLIRATTWLHPACHSLRRKVKNSGAGGARFFALLAGRETLSTERFTLDLPARPWLLHRALRRPSVKLDVSLGRLVDALDAERDSAFVRHLQRGLTLSGVSGAWLWSRR